LGCHAKASGLGLAAGPRVAYICRGPNSRNGAAREAVTLGATGGSRTVGDTWSRREARRDGRGRSFGHDLDRVNFRGAGSRNAKLHENLAQSIGSNVVVNLITSLVGSGLGIAIKVTKNLISIDIDVLLALPSAIAVSFRKFQGHLIVPCWHGESIGNDISLPFGLVKGWVGSSRDAGPRRTGASAHIIFIGGPEIADVVGKGAASGIDAPGLDGWAQGYRRSDGGGTGPRLPAGAALGDGIGCEGLYS